VFSQIHCNLPRQGHHATTAFLCEFLGRQPKLVGDYRWIASIVVLRTSRSPDFIKGHSKMAIAIQTHRGNPSASECKMTASDWPSPRAS
jgi:hypothetical protein